MSDGGARGQGAEPEDHQQLYQNAPDSEYSNSWLHYLQMLNGLCAAGARVSASIRNISSKSGVDISTNDFPGQAEWDTITQNLLAATISAHSQSIPAIHLFEYSRNDIHPTDQSVRINKNIIDNILSIINVQYRFCLTSCERLIAVADDTYKIPSEIAEHEAEPRVQISPFNSGHSECAGLQNPTSHLYPLEHQRSSNSINSLDKIICEPMEAYLYNYSQNLNTDYQVLNRDASSLEQPAPFDKSSGLFNDCRRSSFVGHVDKPRNYQPPIDGRAVCLPNPSNCEIYRGPTIKFLDTVRNLKYSDDQHLQNSYLGTEKGKHKNSIMKNSQFGLHLPPLSSQTAAAHTAQLRRWSEAAAHEMNERQDDSSNIRRWSVPWDGGQPPTTESPGNWGETSKTSTTNLFDRKWTDERDPVETAIFLLSYRPQTGNAEKTNPVIPEQPPRRPPCTSSSVRGYSIWSGSGAIPFLRLPESQE